MTATITMTVSAIPRGRLRDVRARGVDEHGNPVVPLPARGWEPLRCCLTLPDSGVPIALIAYAPFVHRSAWSETGPVYIHAEECDGYGTPHALPDRLRTGPKLLRTYHADHTLDYDHITLVEDGVDIAPALIGLLAEPEVATVHVRSLHAQCYAYSVTR